MLNHVQPDGKIYGYVNTCGCRTYRMTHNSPNLAQVPGAAKPYGLEFRALFKAPSGKKIVGIDASNLEGLFKGHYLQPYDDGAFLDMVLNDGDLHSRNAEILDLTRTKAKTWYYAWVFGASAAKLATITGRSKAVEQRFKDKFLASWPELAALLAGLEAAWKERGYLIGLDGRRLENESAHTLLNTVCQSAGAILMKKALVEFNKRLTENYATSKWEFILNVHDEW